MVLTITSRDASNPFLIAELDGDSLPSKDVEKYTQCRPLRELEPVILNRADFKTIKTREGNSPYKTTYLVGIAKKFFDAALNVPSSPPRKSPSSHSRFQTPLTTRLLRSASRTTSNQSSSREASTQSQGLKRVQRTKDTLSRDGLLNKKPRRLEKRDSNEVVLVEPPLRTKAPPQKIPDEMDDSVELPSHIPSQDRAFLSPQTSSPQLRRLSSPSAGNRPLLPPINHTSPEQRAAPDNGSQMEFLLHRILELLENTQSPPSNANSLQWRQGQPTSQQIRMDPILRQAPQSNNYYNYNYYNVVNTRPHSASVICMCGEENFVMNRVCSRCGGHLH